MKPLKNVFVSSLITSILLSGFIYLEYFDLSNRAINSILGIVGLYYLLLSPKKANFLIGAFIGLFWFYWVGMSFRFTDYPFVSFIVPIGIMLIYGVCFYGLFWIENIFYRAVIILFAFDFIEPFGFTWFKFETIFASSFIFPDKLHFALVLVSIVLFILLQNRKIQFIAPIIPLIFAINFNEEKIPHPDLKIKLVDLHLDQKTKWLREYRKKHTTTAIEHIRNAIKEKYDVVVVPESAIPLYLNRHPSVVEILKNLSNEIDIVLGSLKYEDKKAYNSTYIFRDGDLLVADKVFLVPFGEASPLTGIFGKWVNDTFFEGSDDFITAKEPTDFKLGDTTFRNAICYEAGVEKMFHNAPSYMIVISNNAWFAPSIEPIVQRLVMLSLGRKYGVKIFHSTNMSKSEVIN